jgi:RNA polymerase sigma-70 factor (ECF subfamily)
MDAGLNNDMAIDQVLQGNTDAYFHLVEAHSLALRSYLASQIYALDEVDDLAQEVFIAAYRSLKTFRRGDDFGAWLRGIARHKLQTHFRSTMRRNNALDRFRSEVAEVVGLELEAAVADDRSGDIQVLLRCIAKLPEKLRHVVHAGLDGEKPAQLARDLATSPGAIYQLHYRANQLLRECLRKELAHGS